jgi:hypothetical protein
VESHQTADLVVAQAVREALASMSVPSERLELLIITTHLFLSTVEAEEEVLVPMAQRQPQQRV